MTQHPPAHRRLYRILHLARVVLLGLCFAALAWSNTRGVQGGQPLPDLVDEFRKALKVEPGGPYRPPLEKKERDLAFDYSIQFRRKALERIAGEMHALGDLARALQLQEWTLSDKQVREGADDQVRKDMSKRLQDGLRAALLSSDPKVVIAAEGLIMEMAAALRRQPIDAERDREKARELILSFTPELITLLNELVPELKNLTEQGSCAVRGFAALALGEVGAASLALGRLKHEPADIVPTLQRMLASQNEVEVRRTGAQGIGYLLQSLVAQGAGLPGLRLGPPGLAEIGDDREPRERLRNRYREMGRRIILAVSRTHEGGLVDQDRTVRLRCAYSMVNIARVLKDQVPEGNSEAYPPKGRELTPDERRMIATSREYVQKQFEYYKPLYEAFQLAAPALACASVDPEEDVRKVTLDALDEIITCRWRMRNYLDSVPVPKPETLPLPKPEPKKKEVRAPASLFHTAVRSSRPLLHLTAQMTETHGPIDPALAESATTIEGLIKAMGVADPYSRVLAVMALESMHDEAAPAIPALLKALTDSFRFVRWGAIRTLGKLAPRAAHEAVAGIVPLVDDDDVDVRVAAATALEKFGTAAAPAVEALGRAVGNRDGDGEVRIAAMKALAAIGTAAAPAVPQIAEALMSTNVRVRRSAAETLGRFGPLAVSTAPDLKFLLLDPELDVRKAAGDALINVLGK